MSLSMNHLFAAYQKNIATGDGNRFAARPLNHWRKAYQNSLGYSRAATGMPMDRPGGLGFVASPQIQCATCKGALPAQVTIFKDSNCKSCKPLKSKVKPLQTAYTNTAAYLQSRCATYDQKISVERLPTVTYFSPEGIPIDPTDSPTGTQVRQTENCFSPQIYNTICNTTIYKPNNTQFAQQGGVSASSRLSRLKYNTLNQNGAEYNSASGAMGVNSGRYQSEPSPSYYVKNKPQEGVCERKTGEKSYCPVQVLPP